MAKGGYRQGAGRKKGYPAIQAEKARKFFAEQLAPHMEKVANALIKRAIEGNVPAIHELFDRAWGKALSSTELQITESKAPIIVYDSAFSDKFSATDTKKH